MDRKIASEYTLRALPEAEVGKTGVHYGIDPQPSLLMLVTH